MNLEWGTGTTCGTNTVSLMAVPVAPGGGSPTTLVLYGATAPIPATSGTGISPATQPFVLPSGYNVCLVTAGTTTAVKAIILYTEH